MAPEETIARIKRFMPVMGITRVATVTGLDVIGIPVVMVCRPNARSVSVSQGKGVDLAAAKASGLMETVECFHAERITLPLKLGRYEDLAYTHKLVDANDLPRLSNSRFTPFTPILWIEGYDLLGRCGVWVPYELVHLDYTVPLPSGHGCFVASSNGLASGNHALEAVSHGICEVVERDATTLWHLMGPKAQAETALDLTTVDDPRCRELLQKYERAGFLVAVWETTSDVGIASFLCRILPAEAPPHDVCRPASGMGCHPCREVALSRALTEAAQSRLTFISGARDDLSRRLYDCSFDSATYEAWRTHVDHQRPVRNYRATRTWDGDSFEDEVAWELGRLRSAGIKRVVVVDLTKPEFGIPVVRVIVPGLEGIDHSPDFVFGRRAMALTGAAL